MPEETEIDMQASLTALQGLASAEDIETIGNPIKVDNQSADTTQVDEPNVETNLEENVLAETQTQGEKVEKTTDAQIENKGEADQTQEEIEKNAIFGDQNIADVFKPKEDSIETPEEVSKFMTDQFGVSDVNEFKSQVEKWKGQEPEIERLTEQVNTAEDIFSRMSPELYRAVQQNLKGEEWRESLNSTPSIDFNKDVNSIDTKALVNSMMPGKFTDEDFEEFNDEDGDMGVKKAISMAEEMSKDKFNAKKVELKNSIESEREMQNTRTKAFDDSVSKSLDYLRGSYKGIDESFVKGLENKIKQEGIVAQFYEKDGSLKESAALALLKITPEYDNLVKSQINIAVKEARNKATQELLDRGSDTPNMRSGSHGTKPEIGTKAQQKLKELESLTEGIGY